MMKKHCKVLVPIDFSRYSWETFDFAMGLREHFDVELYLLYVVVTGDLDYFSDLGGMPRTDLERQSSEAMAEFEREVRQRQEKAPDLPVKYQVAAGIPFKEICRFADQQSIGLITIGTHGRSGLSHLLIGSTAERVVQHASCPVLCIKPHIL